LVAVITTYPCCFLCLLQTQYCNHARMFSDIVSARLIHTKDTKNRENPYYYYWTFFRGKHFLDLPIKQTSFTIMWTCPQHLKLSSLSPLGSLRNRVSNVWEWLSTPCLCFTQQSEWIYEIFVQKKLKNFQVKRNYYIMDRLNCSLGGPYRFILTTYSI